MSTKVSIAKIEKNLNLLKGYSVMGVEWTTFGYCITFVNDAGKEIKITQANMFGLKEAQTPAAIDNASIWTLKHNDPLDEPYNIDPDRVVGAVLKNVNVYANPVTLLGGEILNRRITISFQLGIVDTKQTPGITCTTDLAEGYELVL